MITQQRRTGEPEDPWGASSRSGAGVSAGTVVLATMLGVGLGLLAAPQPGSKTRKLLLKRLAALGEGVGDGLDEVQDLSSKAKKRARRRLARLRDEAAQGIESVEDRWQHARQKFRAEEEDEEDGGSGVMGTILAIAAGAAATYFLTSDQAAPVRSRVQNAASDVRRRATDEWDRFQRGGSRGAREGSSTPNSSSETRAGSTPSDEAPQAS
jgi:gas vesicle protein